MLGDLRSDILLVSNVESDVGFASTVGQPTYSLYRDSTEDQFRIKRATDTLLTFNATETKIDQNLLVTGSSSFDGKMTLNDDNTIQLGNTSAPDVAKCVSMLFVANAAIGIGRIVKVVEVGGLARIDVVLPLDPDATGVIGVTMSETTAAGQDISVCIGGVFNACVANGATVTVGDTIEKTDIIGQGGKVWSGAGQGTVGVALTGGTGNIAGTVFVRGIFVKNEVF